MSSEDDKKCIFCNTTKDLKSIWYEEEDNLESCCFSCFNDTDNGLEGQPVGSSEWYSTNYNWENK